MNRKNVDEAFLRYNEIVARIRYLQSAIERLRDRLDREREALSARSPVSRLDGMPHSGNVGSAVEEDCIRAADGDYPADIKRLAELIERLDGELTTRKRQADAVEIGLQAMSEKERYVVQCKYFLGLTYAEIGERYETEYGHSLTRDAVKNIHRSAMSKVYEVVAIDG